MTSSSIPVIDVRSNGLGDVVVACWILYSARAAGKSVRLNPRDRREIPPLLGITGEQLTSDQGPDWSTTPGIGHQFEYAMRATAPMSRFDAWCHSLDLPRLVPVRPDYCEREDDGEWASEQWEKVDAAAAKPRVLLFPDAAWPVRTWPKAYFIDLASALLQGGYAVAAMSGTQATVEFMPCHWWGGFTERQAAAMARRANIVVANESGPAHLAAAIGTRTIAICGPTDPAIVFAHDPNVEAAVLDGATLACVGCHYSQARGYRTACEIGGCQALMRLDPGTVTERVTRALSGDGAALMTHVHDATHRRLECSTFESPFRSASSPT